MKILMLGCGAQGAVIATELIKNPEVSLICADINLEKAKRLADRLKTKNVSTQRVDARNPDDLLRATKGVDVVVSALVWEYNLKTMDASLKSGAHYLNLTLEPRELPGMSIEESVLKVFECSDKWEEAGLTALMGAGVSPGVVNILARHAADKLDRVDEIHIRWFDRVEAKEYIPAWNPEADWMAIVREGMVYENGEFKKVPTFSGEEVYKFPDPIGPQRVARCSDEVVITLPHFIKGVKLVEMKAPLSDTYKFVDQLGLLSDKPIEIKGIKIAPRNVLLALLPSTLSLEEMESKIETGIVFDAYGCVVVKVKGEKAGRKISFTLYLHCPSFRETQEKLPGSLPQSYVTGIPAAILTQMLGSGGIKTKGVISLECLGSEERHACLTKLAEKGIIIHERVEKTLA